MNRIERIKKILKEHLKPTQLILYDNSSEHAGHNNFNGMEMTHLKVEIESENFKGKKLIEIHRLINSLIKKEYENGLHAMEIKIINH